MLLATTRDLLVKKFNIVHEFCLNYGMKVNESKTKYMVINSCVDDKYTIVLNGIKNEYSSTIYLGAVIHDDASYTNN